MLLYVHQGLCIVVSNVPSPELADDQFMELPTLLRQHLDKVLINETV